MSHPSRVRGLKLEKADAESNGLMVAPLAGAWIETRGSRASALNPKAVAPLAGAWIETSRNIELDVDDIVAPLAGAWIETGP